MEEKALFPAGSRAIDRVHIQKVYDQYAGGYDLNDTKIKLKYEHTYRVAQISERIARSLHLSGQDIDMAWTIGIFHDIGRFEQVRRYGTFFDGKSVNHAQLSADILFRDGLAERFLPDGHAELALMETAVRLHNVFQLPADLTPREKLFADILRDADKVDILRVNCETPREEIYGLPREAFEESAMTEEVYQSIVHHEMINRKYSKTGIDFILGHIGFAFGLVFPESMEIVREQGYLKQLLNFRSKNEETDRKMAVIRSDLTKALNL